MIYNGRFATYSPNEREDEMIDYPLENMTHNLAQIDELLLIYERKENAVQEHDFNMLWQHVAHNAKR